MNVRLLPYLKVAERDAREALGNGPLLTLGDFAQYGQPEDEVLAPHAQEDVKENQLTKSIGQVEEFHDQVSAPQVVAVEARPEQATVLGKILLRSRATRIHVRLLLPPQIAVQLHYYVSQPLLACLRVLSLMSCLSCLDYSKYAESRSPAEHSPEKTRTEEEDRLGQKDEGNPLIISDDASLLPVQWHWFFERYEVSVVNPADGVSVLRVGLSELGWTPTVDWSANVRLDADDDCHENEQCRRILATQAVDGVVIVTRFELAKLEDGCK